MRTSCDIFVESTFHVYVRPELEPHLQPGRGLVEASSAQQPELRLQVGVSGLSSVAGLSEQSKIYRELLNAAASSRATMVSQVRGTFALDLASCNLSRGNNECLLESYASPDQMLTLKAQIICMHCCEYEYILAYTVQIGTGWSGRIR